MLLLIKSVLRTLLLPPAGPLLIMVLGIILLRRRPLLARVCLVFAIACLWLLSTPIVSDSLAAMSESYPALDLAHLPNAQAIVILGGGGQLKLAPKYNAPASEPLLLQKLSYGAYLARLTSLPILVSGAEIEADAMSAMLARNFNQTARWVDNQARDTFENAQNSARILDAAGIHRIILVTLGMHMLRAT